MMMGNGSILMRKQYKRVKVTKTTWDCTQLDKAVEENIHFQRNLLRLMLLIETCFRKAYKYYINNKVFDAQTINWKLNRPYIEKFCREIFGFYDIMGVKMNMVYFLEDLRRLLSKVSSDLLQQQALNHCMFLNEMVKHSYVFLARTIKCLFNFIDFETEVDLDNAINHYEHGEDCLTVTSEASNIEDEEEETEETLIARAEEKVKPSVYRVCVDELFKIE